MAQPLCPCGSGVAFRQCCQPFLSGMAIAPTAEALMRSRYSAFATQNVDYLIKTHHRDQRSLQERAELMQSCQQTDWIRLQVLATQDGGIQDQRGCVEFMAVFRQRQLGQIHERSNFVKEAGQWFYTDGQMLPPLTPNRGEPCWCGSGQKYKRCHG